MFSNEEYEKYLIDTFIPYVRKILSKRTNALKDNEPGLESFMAILGKGLKDTSIQYEVRKKTTILTTSIRVQGINALTKH